MFGLVGAGGLAANTSVCSPAGCHIRCEESSSWSMYSSFGSVLSLGAFLLRSHCNLKVKTIVLRSVDLLEPRISDVSANADHGEELRDVLSLISINSGSTFSGISPTRCASTSSTITLVLSQTYTCSIQTVGTLNLDKGTS
jgi:hypothetical protein